MSTTHEATSSSPIAPLTPPINDVSSIVEDDVFQDVSYECNDFIKSFYKDFDVPIITSKPIPPRREVRNAFAHELIIYIQTEFRRRGIPPCSLYFREDHSPDRLPFAFLQCITKETAISLISIFPLSLKSFGTVELFYIPKDMRSRRVVKCSIPYEVGLSCRKLPDRIKNEYGYLGHIIHHKVSKTPMKVEEDEFQLFIQPSIEEVPQACLYVLLPPEKKRL